MTFPLHLSLKPSWNRCFPTVQLHISSKETSRLRPGVCGLAPFPALTGEPAASLRSPARLSFHAPSGTLENAQHFNIFPRCPAIRCFKNDLYFISLIPSTDLQLNISSIAQTCGFLTSGKELSVATFFLNLKWEELVARFRACLGTNPFVPPAPRPWHASSKENTVGQAHCFGGG